MNPEERVKELEAQVFQLQGDLKEAYQWLDDERKIAFQAEAECTAANARNATLHEVLNKRNPESSEDCKCSECLVIRKNHQDFECETCGYHGEPDTLECACYEYSCSPSARGSGCFHGAITCPVCAEGELSSGWDLIKKLRQALAQAPAADPKVILKQPSEIAQEFRSWYESNKVRLSGHPVRDVAWHAWLESYNNETKEVKQYLRGISNET